MNNNPQNAASPFKVFNTEEEWNAEVKKIIESCISYLNQNSRMPNNAAPPNPGSQLAQTVPAGSDPEQQLRAEIAQMEREVPGFDFKRLMMTNESFKNYIMHGYSVKEAYTLSQAKEEAKPSKKRLGIRENGVQGGRAGAPVNDAVSMNDRDFKRYIQSIMGGNL